MRHRLVPVAPMRVRVVMVVMLLHVRAVAGRRGEGALQLCMAPLGGHELHGGDVGVARLCEDERRGAGGWEAAGGRQLTSKSPVTQPRSDEQEENVN